MKLADIRIKTAYNPTALATPKAQLRTWLCGKSKDYPIAITLTLKQVVTEETVKGLRYSKISKDDCERIAKRFTQKLNREVFGKRQAEKYGKGLSYITVVEGERSNKNLHLHFAVGGFPKHIKLNQIDRLVNDAKNNVRNIDEQYKVDIADSGWMEYIIKEVSNKDTDNVLWSLA
jgi:hypothetical protein